MPTAVEKTLMKVVTGQCSLEEASTLLDLLSSKQVHEQQAVHRDNVVGGL